MQETRWSLKAELVRSKKRDTNYNVVARDLVRAEINLPRMQATILVTLQFRTAGLENRHGPMSFSAHCFAEMKLALFRADRA